MSGKSLKTNGIGISKECMEKMVSPVTLIFPDHSKKSYRNGTELAEAVLDRPYVIKFFAAVDDEIGIILVDPETEQD